MTAATQTFATLKSAALGAAPELPDDLRVPLHELRADLDCIIGRIRLEHTDDEVCGMLTESIRNRLSQIEEASYRLLPS